MEKRNFIKSFIALVIFGIGFCSCAFAANPKEDSTGKVIYLTKEEFNKKVVNIDNNSSWKYLGDKPCILDFYANWCGPCRMISPYLDELAKEYQGQIYIYKIDVDKEKELARIRKYCRVIKQPYGAIEKIKCKRLFVMYRCKIDLFEADEVIQIIHADYEAQGLKPNLDERIKEHYAVSKAVAESYERISGVKVGVAYNPLTIDKPKKILRLISATRLTKEKGKERMIKLANELDKVGIPYEWRIFTNDSLPIPNENVIYMKPRLDIRDYIADADYLVQLSDTEAFSYSILESLCLGTPVIITPIPSSIEMGVKNGINGYILDFSMQDIPINEIYANIPKIAFKSPKDIYDKLESLSCEFDDKNSKNF